MNLLCSSQGPACAVCWISAVWGRQPSSKGGCTLQGLPWEDISQNPNIVRKREMANVLKPGWFRKKSAVCKNLVCEDEQWARWRIWKGLHWFVKQHEAAEEALGSLVPVAPAGPSGLTTRSFMPVVSPPTLNGHNIFKAHATADATGTQRRPVVSFFLNVCQQPFRCWLGMARSSTELSYAYRLLQPWFSQLWRVGTDTTLPAWMLRHIPVALFAIKEETALALAAKPI